MKTRIIPIAVLSAVILSCTTQTGGDITNVIDTPGKSTAPMTLYVTGTQGLWTSGTEVSINGKVTVGDADGQLAAFGVEGSTRYHIALPADAQYLGDGRYGAELPRILDASRQFFLGADYAEPSGIGFMTASLKPMTGSIGLTLLSREGVRLRSLKLTSRGGECLSGSVTVDCVSKEVVPVEEGTYDNITLSFGDSGLEVPGLPSSGVSLTVPVLCGDIPGGVDVEMTSTDGRTCSLSAQEHIGVECGKSSDIGYILFSTGEEMLLTVGFDTEDESLIPDTEGLEVSVNGEAVSMHGFTDGRPGRGWCIVPRSEGYAVVWPVSEALPQGGAGLCRTSVPAAQGYCPDPLDAGCTFAGYSASTTVSLLPQTGVVRVRLHTAPGVQRKIRKVKFLGAAVSSDGGEVACTLSDEIPESTDGAAPTDFCLRALPGTFKDARLAVRGFDSSFPIPSGKTSKDLYQLINYELGDITVRPGAVTDIEIGPTVGYFDWIKSNGASFTGSQSRFSTTAAYIDTGWQVPYGRGGSVLYECTMSGALSDFSSDRFLFGSQGDNNNKPVFFLFDSAGGKQWYTTMASVGGKSTYKQETGGKQFHIDRSLPDRRVLQAGCDGVFGSSYIYTRFKNLDRGDTQWTMLSEESPYFLFSGGNLNCLYSLTIFGKNQKDDLVSPATDIRIHGFKIWWQGSLVYDLVPCTVDLIPGMCNMVDGSFYFNASPSTVINLSSGTLSPFIVGN